MSVLDTIANASPARKSVTLCLEGALQAEWDALSNSLNEAAIEDQFRSLGDIPKTTAVVEGMEALRERMAASEVAFEFERMPWQDRVDLQSKHPPRDKHLLDLARGYNTNTFMPELVKRSCVSLTGADGDAVTEIPDGTWETLLGTSEADGQPAVAGTLNFKQVDKLVTAANAVNDGLSSVPISARSLLENRASGASSQLPGPGPAPRPSGGAAGNRRTARKSSTTKKAASPGKSART